MAEPDPRRDIGPYESEEQILKQFAATTYGIPGSRKELCGIVLREALLLAGVQPSEFELRHADAHWIDPVMAQILAGWLIRARLADKSVHFTGRQDP